jgi:hypothetical protein
MILGNAMKWKYAKKKNIQKNEHNQCHKDKSKARSSDSNQSSATIQSN